MALCVFAFSDFDSFFKEFKQKKLKIRKLERHKAKLWNMISIYDKRFWFQAKTWKQETFSFLKNSLRNTFESVFHCCDRKTCKKFDMFTSHANFFFEGNFFCLFWEQVVYPCLHTSDINPFFVQLYQQSGVYRDNKSQWKKRQ